MSSTVNLSKPTVNLSKGEVINLTKESEGLSNIMIGLGWTQAHLNQGFLQSLVQAFIGGDGANEIDCDAWVIATQGKRRVLRNEQDVIFYNNKLLYNAKGYTVITHHGDNLVGGNGKTDDEEISINLTEMPPEVDTITIAVTIYRGVQRGQSFADIQDIFVRIVDQRDNHEICRFNKSDMDRNSITFIAGQLYKENNEWLFRAIGASTSSASISEEVRNSWYR
jgi:stress response protein SCP2